MNRQTLPSVLLMLVLPGAALAQDSITCQASSSPVTARKEGLTEQVGPISLDCTGGIAGSRVSGSLAVFLNRTLSNRTINDAVQEAQLQVDTGTGFRPAGAAATRNGNGGVTFTGFSFDIPASRRFLLQVSRLRAEIAGSDQPVTATISLSGLSNLALNSNFLIVGQPLTGLFSSTSFADVQGTTKAMPATFEEAVRDALPSFTTRVTEGFSTAFQSRQEGADTGVRVMIRYSAVPAGVRLAVPDVVSGSSSNEPTSAGGFGGPVQAGRATPGTLLLVRVPQPGADGSGGLLSASGQQLPFGALREVPLQGGAGLAVFEVLDGNAFLTESAQIPTFIEIRSLTSGLSRTSVSLAPVRSAGSSAGPILSFIDVAPGTDCQSAGDCQAGPRLVVNADPLTVMGLEGTGFQIRYVRINNGGGGGFAWNARIEYRNGSGWLRLDRTEGVAGSTIRIDFLPDRVTGPGIYNATLTIDAGPAAGSRALPIQFVVTENPVLRAPLINTIGHAATFQEEIVPGGLAYLRGVRLEGRNVELRAGGMAARILYRSAEQINFEVPAALAGRDAADLVVTVDGIASTAKSAKLRVSLPGIFPGGVLNENGAANGPAQPAAPGSVVSLVTTGIPAFAIDAVTLRILAEEGVQPLSVVTTAEAPGVQFVTVRLAEELRGPTVDMQVCAAQVCSPAVKLAVAP